jgi:hypothetical protein
VFTLRASTETASSTLENCRWSGVSAVLDGPNRSDVALRVWGNGSTIRLPLDTAVAWISARLKTSPGPYLAQIEDTTGVALSSTIVFQTRSGCASTVKRFTFATTSPATGSVQQAGAPRRPQGKSRAQP